MAFWSWSRTPATNATADLTINWAEGQAPSSINDSARAMMARVAEYRDDIAGAIVTGGTSTAYTVASYEVFDTLAHMNGQMIAFTPHTTNGATVTLNVDGLGAKPLRSAPSTELLAGTIIQGTPYVAVYNNSDAAWYLQGFYGNPYSIPLGGMLPFTCPTAPNSSFVFPYGQAISRSTYSAYFALVGTTYGPGDGSTTFNVADLRGRVIAGKDDMGGVAASRLTSAGLGAAAALGATGGAERETIAAGNLPANIPNTLATSWVPASGTGTFWVGTTHGQLNTVGGSGVDVPTSPTNVSVNGTVTLSGSINGSSANTPLITVQPTIVGNYILRII